MREAHRMPKPPGGDFPQPLLSGQKHKCIINLRGAAERPEFAAAVERALGIGLPSGACTTLAGQRVRIVWAGPDDWFILADDGHQAQLTADLQQELADQHVAVTDVSSGYFEVTLAGPQARDVLAGGCPIDLHPLQFSVGKAVGSHFHQVGIYLWQEDEAPTYKLLVRRSYIDHFWQLIGHGALECGWSAIA